LKKQLQPEFLSELQLFFLFKELRVADCWQQLSERQHPKKDY